MSRYTTARFGSIEVLTGSLNMNGLPIHNVRDPEVHNDVATKGYVDNMTVAPTTDDATVQLKAGGGLILTGDTMSISPTLNDLSLNTCTAGNLNVTDKITIPVTPATPAEAASKQYVDQIVDAKLSIKAGNGLVVTDGTFSVDSTVVRVGASSAFRSAVQHFRPQNGDTIILGDFPNTFIDPETTLTSLTIELPKEPQDGQSMRIRTTQNIEDINTIGEFHTGENQDLPPSLDVDEVIHYIYLGGSVNRWYRF